MTKVTRCIESTLAKAGFSKHQHQKAMNPQGFSQMAIKSANGSSEPGCESRKSCKTFSLSKPASAKKARKGQ
jgi:hypothetical protein